MDPLLLILLMCLAFMAINRTDKALERSRKRKRLATEGPQAICGCDDHYAFHDPATGHCHATSKVASKWDSDGIPVGWSHRQCGCRQYVGPQPLDTYYAPEITNDITPPRLTKSDPEED